MATTQIECLTEILIESGTLGAGLTTEFGPPTRPLIASLLDAIDTVVFVTDPNGGLRYVAAEVRVAEVGEAETCAEARVRDARVHADAGEERTLPARAVDAGFRRLALPT